jgi:DNA-binding transcriptional MerR regulator
MNATTILTIGDVARHFGVRPWKVRALYERGLLPPAARLRSYRIVTDDDLPRIEQALRDAGYLGEQEAEPCAP